MKTLTVGSAVLASAILLLLTAAAGAQTVRGAARAERRTLAHAAG